MTMTEVATIIFFRKKASVRNKEQVVAVYVDGELFEYNNDVGTMEKYIDGFSDGIAYKKPDGSIKFVRGTAHLQDDEQPPLYLGAVVTRGVEWQRDNLVSSETEVEDEQRVLR